MSAAPAESEISTETTIMPETTSTALPETSTSIIDARQNEIDAKFSNDEKLTTFSEVDKKIESIGEDSIERSTAPNDMIASEMSAEVLPEATTEAVDETTIISKPEAEKAQDINHENENITKLDRAMEKNDQTTNETPEDINVTVFPELAAKAEALQQIKKLLRAHVLRSVFTILNEAKQNQFQQQKQHASESQIAEETIYFSSAGANYPNSGDDTFDYNFDNSQYVRSKHFLSQSTSLNLFLDN